MNASTSAITTEMMGLDHHLSYLLQSLSLRNNLTVVAESKKDIHEPIPTLSSAESSPASDIQMSDLSDDAKDDPVTRPLSPLYLTHLLTLDHLIPEGSSYDVAPSRTLRKPLVHEKHQHPQQPQPKPQRRWRLSAERKRRLQARLLADPTNPYSAPYGLVPYDKRRLHRDHLRASRASARVSGDASNLLCRLRRLGQLPGDEGVESRSRRRRRSRRSIQE